MADETVMVDTEGDATKSGKRLQAAKLAAARAAVMTLAELVKWAGYEDETPEDAEPDKAEAEDAAPAVAPDAKPAAKSGDGSAGFDSDEQRRAFFGTRGDGEGDNDKDKSKNSVPVAHISGVAVNGKVRQIAGKKVNTADIVNAAIAESHQAQLDLGRAEQSLLRLGHRSPPAETIASYARQVDILNRIAKATGSNAGGQIGKWDFANAQTIHDDFLSYLDRRIGGQHARWTESHKSENIDNVYLAAIKSQTATSITVAGYGIVPGYSDIDGETFTRATDFDLDLVPVKRVYYDHGFDPGVKDEALGITTKAAWDDTGLWVEMQLDRAKRYARAVAALVAKGALGISSGSVPHLVRKSAGEIKYWPIVEFSLTPTPSEHRTVGVRELKSLAAAYPELEALLTEPSEPAATQDSATRNEPPASLTGALKHQECAAMAENQTPALDVAAIVSQAVEQGIKAYRLQLEQEPALKTAGVTVPAEVKAAGPLYTGLGEFLLDVAHASGGGPSRKLAEVKSSDPLDEGGYNLTRAMGAEWVGSLTNAKRGLAVKAPTGLNEGVGAQGGYLVNTDRPGTLMAKVYDTAQVLSRVRMLPISTNANGLTLNAEDETSRADGYRRGGIQAYWLSEAGTKLSTMPKFRQMELKLKKVVGLAYATDELLGDAAQLETWIMDNLPEELRFKAEDSVFNGSGAGMPVGVLTSLGLITVAKETGQAADTVVFENIIKMYARMWTRSLGNAVWYISGDVWPQLYKMYAVAGTGGTPVYLPPGGLSAAPYGTLMGRPVLPVEYCAKLGDLGDIVFADLSQYQMIDKGGIQSASSIHVAFTTDQTCFRFVYRIDGQPTWNSPLTPKNGGDTVSPYVTLAAR